MSLPGPAPDRTAVVTGASSGIGEEIARELVRRGHGVTLVARRADRLEKLAADLSTKGVRAEVMAADLAQAGPRAELLERIAGLGLTPDILVNNAGFSTLGPVAAADPASEVAMVEVNVTAVVDLTTRFVRGMVERGRGSVINIASTAAFQPFPGQAGYAASKAFVLSYTRAVAAELRSSGVTATAVCPGPVATEFMDTAGFEPVEAESMLPKMMWLTAANVARIAVAAADRGRDHVIPGLANRVTANLSHLSPKQFVLPVLARQHPGMRRK